MGDSDLELGKQGELAKTNADEAALEDSNPAIQRDASFSPGRSCESTSMEGVENGELPLIQGGDSPRSNFFRQRSMHSSSNGHVGDANGKKVASFDVENGIHTSDSMAKLESLEQAAHNSISAVVVLKTLFYILVWYTFSTCLTLYNKTLLGEKLGKFPAPLLMNTFHFTLQAVLSKIIVCFQSRGPDNSVKMTWKDYFLRVQISLPIFLLLFAFAFRLETPSIRLLGIILVISVGVLLTVAKETEFEFWGFIFVMLAAVMSGFRWSMTQILLQKEAYGLKDPITLMSNVTPVMAVATLILSLAMDPWNNFETNVYFDNPWHIVRSCLLMLIGGALAFFMVLTEYILVSATSAVTVTIAGVVKEAVTILVAVFYFHDQFTLLKGIGLLTILLGVSLFNWYKYEKYKKGQLIENEEVEPSSNVAAKYVILDDLDLQDDDT